MSIAMPETIAYGKVVGRFIQAVGDTADVDLLPDVVPIQGNITFTPATPLSKEVSVAPPTTVVRSAITCSLNAQGLLTSPAGDVGVWLVAGVYKVAYSTQGATIPPHDIVVSSFHTSDNALDLTVALPPGGPVLSPSQFAELSYRIEHVESVPGLSAYEVAVDNGFVGDEAAWLASLVGATGPTGATGPVSATGGAPVKAALPSVNVNWVNAETGAWFLGTPSYPGGGAVPTYGVSLVRVTHPFAARIPVTPGEVITFSVGNPIYRASVTVLNAAHASLYDSGWITTTPLTYTIPANGASLCILLSHADNSTLSAAEITKANLKLEFAAAKTAFSRHPSDVATYMARRPDVSGLLMPTKFRFIAHRGAYTISPILPENSMAAFARAGANAAFWAIETDAQQTSDGRFVLMHDLTVDRTTNGTGTVTAMTYAAVRACILDSSAEPVPNLTEYLLECKKWGKAAVIELKAVTNLAALVDEIIAAGMEEAAVIIDAGWTKLESIRALSPRIHIMYLGSLAPVNTARAFALGRCGINAADQPAYLTAANILDAHRYGVFVIPQVINTGARTTELFNLGCDGITTDNIVAVP